jgi:hypothetical protein
VIPHRWLCVISLQKGAPTGGMRPSRYNSRQR